MRRILQVISLFIVLFMILSIPYFIIKNKVKKINVKLEKYVPKNVQTFVVEYIKNIQSGDENYLKERSLKGFYEINYKPFIDKLNTCFLEDTIKSINIYDANYQKLDGDIHYQIWLEIEQEKSYGNCYSKVKKIDGNLIVERFNYNSSNDSIVDKYKFFNVIFNLPRILFLIFMALFWTCGTTLAFIMFFKRQKWIYILLCSLSIFKITFFWTSGQILLNPWNVSVTPIAIFHSGNVGEWQLSISVPIILIVFCFQIIKRKLKKNEKFKKSEKM